MARRIAEKRLNRLLRAANPVPEVQFPPSEDGLWTCGFRPSSGTPDTGADTEKFAGFPRLRALRPAEHQDSLPLVRRQEVSQAVFTVPTSATIRLEGLVARGLLLEELVQEERARRQDRLQRAEAAFDPLPFDTDAARAYGRIFSAVMVAGRRIARLLGEAEGAITVTFNAAGLSNETLESLGFNPNAVRDSTADELGAALRNLLSLRGMDFALEPRFSCLPNKF